MIFQNSVTYAVLFYDTVSSTDCKQLYLKDDQWVMMEQMVKIFKALQVATTELCEAKVVAMSLVNPVVNGLLKKHLFTTSGDVPTVKRFKQMVTTEINVACQFNPVSRSYPVVSGLPPSTDGGCFGRCAGFHGFSY